MKLVMAMFILLAGIVSKAELLAPSTHQMVINVQRQDFKPLQEVSWRVMVGNSSLSLSDGAVNSSGSGLGLGVEKMLTDRWSVGGYYSNVRAYVSDSSATVFSPEANDYVRATNEYRANIDTLSAYGKYAFVNYPVNKWNLIQVSLLGGIMVIDHTSDRTNAIYGAAVSYDYDNLIGFELNTKVDTRAQGFTTANLIGYF